MMADGLRASHDPKADRSRWAPTATIPRLDRAPTMRAMDEGRDSLLAQALRVGAVLATLLAFVVLATDPGMPLELDPVRLASDGIGSVDLRLACAVVLGVTSLIMMIGGIARPLGMLVLAIASTLALAGVESAPGLPREVALVAALARLPGLILLLLLVIRWPADAAGEPFRIPRALNAGLALALATFVLSTLVYDRHFDPRCSIGCVAGPALVPIEASAHLLVNRWVDAVVAVTAGCVIAVVARWAWTTRLWPRSVGLGMMGAASAVSGVAVMTFVPGEGSAGAVGWVAAGVTTAGLLAVTLGMAAWAWRTLALRVRLERAAADVAIATRERPAATLLADALGAREVELAFPLPDGSGDVDREGEPTVARADGGGTAIVRAGAPIATVHGLASAPGATIRLPPALLAVVDLERLRALRLAGLRALRESRSRIVAVADTERRRIERDLHDGAQHRLLTVAIDLRLARARAERDGTRLPEGLAEAEGVAFEALEILRRLARGIHPAILTQAGLGPALSSLAEEAPVPVTLRVDRALRLPPVVEGIAFRAVSEMLAAAPGLGASEVTVAITSDPPSAVVDIELDGAPPELDERLIDRVGAVGGVVKVEALPGRHRVRAVMPCA